MTVLPEIQNIMSNLPFDQNGTGTDTSSDERGFGYVLKDPKTKFTKDSRAACDLRENTTDFTPYTIEVGSETFYVAL